MEVPGGGEKKTDKIWRGPGGKTGHRLGRESVNTITTERGRLAVSTGLLELLDELLDLELLDGLLHAGRDSSRGRGCLGHLVLKKKVFIGFNQLEMVNFRQGGQKRRVGRSEGAKAPRLAEVDTSLGSLSSKFQDIESCKSGKISLLRGDRTSKGKSDQCPSTCQLTHGATTEKNLPWVFSFVPESLRL